MAPTAMSRHRARATDERQSPATSMTGRIAVAVSGGGSNLRALHAAAGRGEVGGDIVLVVSDRPCAAVEWAAGEGIDTAIVAGGDDQALADVLAGAGPDVVVLAG